MHKAKAVVITCMDFRFQEKIQEFLKRKDYLGHCDQIIIAGGGRDFISPVEIPDGQYVWKQLELSMKLHDPEEIIIIDHQDCGGYAQDDTIPLGLPIKEDMARHGGFLTKLQAILANKYQKKVTLYYAQLDGKIIKLTS
jgi:carbonic anhydrase